MPLVKPKEKEKREDFISRCMADDKTTSEFDTTEQRLAVCNSQYENNKKEKYSMNDIEKMGEAIKSLTDVISSKEKNYGGDGSNAKPKKPQSEAFIDTNAMDEEDMEKFIAEYKGYEPTVSPFVPSAGTKFGEAVLSYLESELKSKK